eukprot:COSAG01_NODE_5463_length_4246_cov_39.670364_6_plen_133_part_00
MASLLLRKGLRQGLRACSVISYSRLNTVNFEVKLLLILPGYCSRIPAGCIHAKLFADLLAVAQICWPKLFADLLALAARVAMSFLLSCHLIVFSRHSSRVDSQFYTFCPPIRTENIIYINILMWTFCSGVKY